MDITWEAFWKALNVFEPTIKTHLFPNSTCLSAKEGSGVRWWHLK